ncbi:MAG: DNA/RNA nuclease SfsA [Deltaproteobacteria bacterium]|nr:DNA/RNA nuclease SfsA [Deltaproteobacteria bacterium]
MTSIPFPPLIKGKLIKRYKRFLADVVLESGEIVTSHNTNTGSMEGCSESGRDVYLSVSHNPKRKYPYTWELIEMEKTLVGVNTMLPNKLSALAFREGAVEGVGKLVEVKSEVKYGESRLDLRLTTVRGKHIYVEVKNCTYVVNGVALFPDAKSQRAAKHLLELMDIVKEGHRAIILIMVARKDARSFAPADLIDPLFGKTLREALKGGVELMVHQEELSLREAAFGASLPYEL